MTAAHWLAVGVAAWWVFVTPLAMGVGRIRNRTVRVRRSIRDNQW